ncbi:MAG: hypothetical protein C0505_00560 [Leptothrix sp. (in: Bacteria)]|nr:hypothetical protein [Leptothrix sp. (in: b-proteobacteria)]
MPILAALAVVLAVALVIGHRVRRGPDLGAEFARRRAALLAAAPAPAKPELTEALIAPLPAPVQRYLRVTGAMGKPPVRSVELHFDAEMFSRPGAAGLRGPALQIDRFDLPRRLFFMRTRKAGLPAAVLHDYRGAQASMQVRLASLFDVVDLRGDALARTETVTLLNDLCFFAPSWLVDARLAWTAINDRRCAVSFTQGPHCVRAALEFNDAGELVNFHSEDRGARQKDGSLRLLHWATPMRDYREFEGRRVATRGEAVWSYPEGDFVYGRLSLTHITFDATP